jgi:hypothetical protein
VSYGKLCAQCGDYIHFDFMYDANAIILLLMMTFEVLILIIQACIVTIIGDVVFLLKKTMCRCIYGKAFMCTS